jgi:hypothetical protein
MLLDAQNDPLSSASNLAVNLRALECTGVNAGKPASSKLDPIAARVLTYFPLLLLVLVLAGRRSIAVWTINDRGRHSDGLLALGRREEHPMSCRPAPLATIAARRAGPREHGRQAARSTRDRPSGHASRETDPATATPPEAAS